MKYVINLAGVNSSNIDSVGGKNASIGEMIQNLSSKGINIPGGFATTADAYKKFLSQQELDKKIIRLLASLKISNVIALNKTSTLVRRCIIATPFFPEFEKEIAEALSSINKTAFAIRSSATAED